MHSRPDPVVQVLVEPCLQRSEGKDGPNPSAGKAGTFQKFRFTRKGTGGSIVPESGKESF